MTTMKIIGTTKVASQTKITVIRPVAELLGVKPGDILAFLQSINGDIILKNISDIEMKDVEGHR